MRRGHVLPEYARTRFIAIACTGMQGIWEGKNDVKGEEIERNGRFAYTKDDFARSGLCRELNEYGKSHGVRICAVSASE